MAHARVSERHEWVLNEKRLVQRAGLDEGTTGTALGIERLAIR